MAGSSKGCAKPHRSDTCVPSGGSVKGCRVTLTLDSEADAERIYGLLAEGGEIFMKMEKTPFANRFAMLRDRFGTSWMLLHQPGVA